MKLTFQHDGISFEDLKKEEIRKAFIKWITEFVEKTFAPNNEVIE